MSIDQSHGESLRKAQSLFAALFPEPKTDDDEKHLLWAFHYGCEYADDTDRVNPVWFHPGIEHDYDPENTDERGGFTRDAALKSAKSFGMETCKLHFLHPSTREKLAFMLENAASAYAWFRAGKPDERLHDEQLAWWRTETGGLDSIVGQIESQPSLFDALTEALQPPVGSLMVLAAQDSQTGPVSLDNDLDGETLGPACAVSGEACESCQ